MKINADYMRYFEPRITELANSLKDKPGGNLLSEKATEEIILTGEKRILRVTVNYFMDLSAKVVKDDNPLAQYDLMLLTREDKEKAAKIILDKLDSGEFVLPERMQKTVDVILRNYGDFISYMLQCLSNHREAICELLFGGKIYTQITGVHLEGDSHNHGKSTTVVETDAGKMVFKPHSCAIDAMAYEFMGKYFDDVIVMPKVYAHGEEFGVCEFLEKRVAEGDKEAKAYYYSLGGTGAVIKMLGSIDMHMENLFACGTKLALIDIETLLYPYLDGIGRGRAGYYAPEDEKAISNSLLRAAFLNMHYEGKFIVKEFSILLNTEEEGSAPIVDGQRRSVLDYSEEFFRGFSDVYDRCLAKKEELKHDIRESFSKHILRVIVWATRSYSDIINRLNSCYSYSSEEYYQSQLDKLPDVLLSEKQVKNDAVTKSEMKHLSEGEIPFFYTYADSRDIYADGELVSAGYYTLSAEERVFEIIDSLSEEEKQFEIHLMQLSLSYTRIRDEKEVKNRLINETEPVTKEKAIREAEAIFERIYKDGLKLKSGERTWFGFDPGAENCTLMSIGLYSGTVGMAVFFAAMAKAAVTDSVRRRAKECLTSAMNMLERYLDTLPVTGGPEDKQKVSLGEGGGLGGILRALVLVNRYTNGEYDSLLEKAKNLTCRINPEFFEYTDKSGGISGLIVTLCRYEELYSDEKIQKLTEKLANRLLELRTLDYNGTLLWKTIKNHPVSGAVHGMTGIAESFLMADLRCGCTKYEKDAVDALEFDDSCFDPELGSYKDMRIPGSRKPARGNCYGSEGMGIICTRLKNNGIKNSVTERILANAQIAVPLSNLYPLDHLCCGNMSTVDYYLETGDDSKAGILLAQVIKYAEQNGRYSIGFADFIPNNNVTLFFGLAGIGYELIRYTNKEEFLTAL